MAKANKTPAPFSPVVLTLESQIEVDAVFAALNHTKIADPIRDFAGGVDVPMNIRDALRPHKSPTEAALFSKICAGI